MSLEEALDENFREIQRKLTQLHVDMRQLAVLTEQEVDPVDDFKESVKFEDEASDQITGMVRLLEEIPPMAHMITGTAPPECREWFAAHRAERKIKLAQEKADHKAASDKAKLELKARLKGGPDSDSKTSA
jgi:hypothetical protein